jgi:hypothetical protein
MEKDQLGAQLLGEPRRGVLGHCRRR